METSDSCGVVTFDFETLDSGALRRIRSQRFGDICIQNYKHLWGSEFCRDNLLLYYVFAHEFYW